MYAVDPRSGAPTFEAYTCLKDITFLVATGTESLTPYIGMATMQLNFKAQFRIVS